VFVCLCSFVCLLDCFFVCFFVFVFDCLYVRLCLCVCVRLFGCSLVLSACLYACVCVCECECACLCVRAWMFVCHAEFEAHVFLSFSFFVGLRVCCFVSLLV